MVYSFDDAKARSPRKTQYFEMFGNRALYDNGWIAACRHGKLPWVNIGTFRFEDDTWELYNLDEDFSEANDLAAKNPKKLKDLQDLFWVEAAKYNVLPLDDRFVERLYPGIKPSLVGDRKQFVYLQGAARITEGSATVNNKSYTITADLDVPPSGAEGVIVANGGVVGGYSLYVKGGRPAFQYNFFSMERYTITSSESLPSGKTTVVFTFDYDGGGLGRGGEGRLFIDGKKVGEGRIEKTVPAGFSANETFDTGRDTGSPASDAYESPFPFTGTISKVVFDVASPKLTAEDTRLLQQYQQRGAAAAE